MLLVLALLSLYDVATVLDITYTYDEVTGTYVQLLFLVMGK
jgi:hypothetical protein